MNILGLLMSFTVGLHAIGNLLKGCISQGVGSPCTRLDVTGVRLSLLVMKKNNGSINADDLVT